jgi:hypothetical protein
MRVLFHRFAQRGCRENLFADPGPTGTIPGDTVGGEGRSTAVIRNEGDIAVLPAGEDAVAQWAVKFVGLGEFNQLGMNFTLQAKF